MDPAPFDRQQLGTDCLRSCTDNRCARSLNSRLDQTCERPKIYGSPCRANCFLTADPCCDDGLRNGSGYREIDIRVQLPYVPFEPILPFQFQLTAHIFELLFVYPVRLPLLHIAAIVRGGRPLSPTELARPLRPLP